jgi:L-cystine transport system substrate-binding protein
MKRNILVLALSAALAGPAFAASLGTLTPGTLSIGMEGTYAPFTFKNDSGVLTGFDVDIATALAARVGLKPRFVLTEWSGILAGLQANKFDVVINQVGVTPERQKSILFGTPYAYSSAQVIVKKSSPLTLTNLASLKGKRVGVGLGSNYEKLLRDAGGINIVTYPGAPEYLADLAAGRLDAAVNDRLLVGYLIKQQNLPVKGAGVLDTPQPVAVALRQNSTALKAALDKALIQIKADGTYSKISRKWFGQDVSQAK